VAERTPLAIHDSMYPQSTPVGVRVQCDSFQLISTAQELRGGMACTLAIQGAKLNGPFLLVRLLIG
jgi:hypothetical protein